MSFTIELQSPTDIKKTFKIDVKLLSSFKINCGAGVDKEVIKIRNTMSSQCHTITNQRSAFTTVIVMLQLQPMSVVFSKILRRLIRVADHLLAIDVILPTTYYDGQV